MLARLILALLLAAFALPASAPAACHDAPAAHAMPMSGPMSGPMDHAPEQKATPPHGCIGCVPPSNWTAARTLDVVQHVTVPPVARAAMLDIRGAAAPGLRPPRLA